MRGAAINTGFTETLLHIGIHGKAWNVRYA